MEKAPATFLVIFVLFLGVSIYAGHRIIPSDQRELTGVDFPQPGKLSGQNIFRTLDTEEEYKKIKLAFNPFDLAAGLTRVDLETLPLTPAPSFYLLLAGLWLVWALKRSPIN
jgi:hypothetical protein